jgi:hypothetical protein
MYRNLGLKEIQDLLVFLSDEIVTNYDVIAKHCVLIKASTRMNLLRTPPHHKVMSECEQRPRGVVPQWLPGHKGY